MKTFTDMLGRTIALHQVPSRIVSIVPSQTELLFDLGLADEVVGITKFCIHPNEWFRSKKRVGGTKNLNLDVIDSLKPDLIIANREENTKEQVDLLAERYPVWISDIKNLNDALAMIVQIGALVGKTEKAAIIAHEISEKFASLQSANRKSRVAYFIWNAPKMSVGNDTFIHHIITAAGWENVFSDKERYPEITDKMLAHSGAEFVLLSSEPFPFSEKHVAEYQLILPHAQILLVDGEMFSWYGSRLLNAPEYIGQLLQKTVSK
jgi:ABC-type Fe3+-hydroxamate transport system substrate-binding protein